jgi:hypothetical protein
MMTIQVAISIVLGSVVGAFTSTGCGVTRLHFIQQQKQQPTPSMLLRPCQSSNKLTIPQAFSRKSLEICDSTQPWLDKGLLLSSFTDGLKFNREAQDWLCEALVERLWNDVQMRSEEALQLSNIFSPCNGPDPFMWQQLENIDQKVQEIYPKTRSNDDAKPSSWKQSLELLRMQQQQQSQVGACLEVRLLYIPTALYSLRKDSTSTPGKQRQRARADGKKRRNEIVVMLQENLKGLAISAMTLDLDDGSVKQPERTAPNVNVAFPTV